MDENKTQRRDRDGEIFENDLTEEDMAPPPVRDDADHQLDMEGEETDSQAGDDFMKERKFPH